MKLILIAILSAGSVAAIWLLCSLALARLRGWQLSRDIRAMEGREFIDPDCHPVNNRRVLAVKWEDSI